MNKFRILLLVGIALANVGTLALATVPSAPVSEEAMASIRALMVGRWTDSGDCSRVTEFLPGGILIMLGGSVTTWSINNAQLTLGDTKFQIRNLTGSMIELENSDGRRGISNRCPQPGDAAKGIRVDAPPLAHPLPTLSLPVQDGSLRNRHRAPVSPIVPKSLPDAAATCERTLQSGDWLRAPDHINEVHHQVTVKNGSDAAAVVKILDTDSGTSWLFYVARDRSGSVPVNDGRYRIQYALGGRLAADCENVIQPKSVAQFDGVVELSVKHDGPRYSTTEVELTLYQVAGGNVSTKKISSAEFNQD